MKLNISKTLLIFIKNLLCPLTGAIIALIAVSYVFILILPKIEDKKSLVYDRSTTDFAIKNEIKEVINDCGEGYFFSWILFSQNGINSKYRFDDVIGCYPTSKKDCTFSVKDLDINKTYDKESKGVDEKTLGFLEKMKTGTAGYYDDIEYLINEYPTIAKIINGLNRKIEEIAIVATKDIRNNTIYIFTLANTSTENKSCDRKRMVKHLEKISSYAGDNI